jgi:mono/diheme cytochrome c family protein
MRSIIHLLVACVIVVASIAVVGVVYARTTGLRSQAHPGSIEARLARTVRSLAIPAAERSRTNPQAASQDARARGLEHFARYCALCHANDGTGANSAFGQGLFPKPPDMRTTTQSLTDGELFYIIENGVRFTGMPAFGTGERTPAGETQTWELVTFIRHIPQLTPDEIGYMESLNPL